MEQIDDNALQEALVRRNDDADLGHSSGRKNGLPHPSRNFIADETAALQNFLLDRFDFISIIPEL